MTSTEYQMTETAAQAVHHASESAGRAKAGTAHLLFGIVMQESCVGALVLSNLGITADQVQAEISRMFEAGELEEE